MNKIKALILITIMIASDICCRELPNVDVVQDEFRVSEVTFNLNNKIKKSFKVGNNIDGNEEVSQIHVNKSKSLILIESFTKEVTISGEVFGKFERTLYNNNFEVIKTFDSFKSMYNTYDKIFISDDGLVVYFDTISGKGNKLNFHQKMMIFSVETSKIIETQYHCGRNTSIAFLDNNNILIIKDKYPGTPLIGEYVLYEIIIIDNILNEFCRKDLPEKLYYEFVEEKEGFIVLKGSKGRYINEDNKVSCKFQTLMWLDKETYEINEGSK